MMYLPFLLCRGYVAAKAAAKEEDALPPSFGPFQISCVLPSPKLTAMAASMRSISSPSTRPMRSRRRRLSSVRTCSSRHHAVARQTVVRRGERDMRRQLRLVRLGRNRGGDHRRAVAVAGVVLDDEHRTHAALLAPDHGREVGVIDIASSDIGIHASFTLREEVPAASFATGQLSFSHTRAGFIRSVPNFSAPPPTLSYARRAGAVLIRGAGDCGQRICRRGNNSAARAC